MSSTLDINEEKKRQLKQLFPEVFCEDVIDFDQLQRVLGKWIDPGKERFGLNWHGKAECIKVAQQPIIGTLKPCREESINFDETNNVFIEGENLEVLKLLQKSYFGKVKMIYIDPPYNTGQDFIYNDDYKDSLENYLRLTNQIDESGKRFSPNTESSGRYHSNWLNMMYPRLYLARNLLREDGVIFISIDDRELENLKALCCQIFGEENFVGCLVWRKKEGGGMADNYFVTEHEYLLVFRTSDQFIWIDKLLEPKESEYNRRDKQGTYKLLKLAKWGNTARREERPSMYFSIIDPDGNKNYPIAPDGSDGRWRVGHTSILNLLQNKLIEFLKKEDQWVAYEKIYYDPHKYRISKLRSIMYDIGGTAKGTNELTNIFGKKDYFENPKPINLLDSIAHGNLTSDDIILDFFAGSGTTAHAVMDLNQKDGGTRKYICVQIPELCNEKSEAFKAGYKTIADIAKERIRRASQKIAKENSAKAQTLDLGFKVFKLDCSNFKVWDNQACDIDALERQLELFIDHINPNSSTEDILYELLLKTGFPLTAQVEKIQIVQRDVYSVEDGKLLICLEKKITSELINALSEVIPCPAQVICLDAGFQGNDQLKVNTVQTFKTRGQAEKREIIFRTI